MRLYGIIGFPLSHSFSPDYFNGKFAAAGIDARYEAFPIRHIAALPALLQQQPELCGFNVTIPYKTAVLPYLRQLSPEAAAMQAVNCVRVIEGQLYGHNTDHWGFSESLKPLLPANGKMHALILGTGGSSRAVAYALEQLCIPYRYVSRHPQGPGSMGYEAVDETILQQFRLIINTTPLGMFPDTEQCPPLPYHLLGNDHILFDLVYNPGRTLFLRKGGMQGAITRNGADMLRLQAERSWDIWTQD